MRPEKDLIPLDYISQRIRRRLNGRKMKKRPNLYCYVCKTEGHRTSRCPTITCIKCHEVGHAEIDCPADHTSYDEEMEPGEIRVPQFDVIKDVTLFVEGIYLCYGSSWQLIQLGAIAIQDSNSQKFFRPIFLEPEIAKTRKECDWMKRLRYRIDPVTKVCQFVQIGQKPVTCVSEKAALTDFMHFCRDFKVKLGGNVHIFFLNGRVAHFITGRLRHYNLMKSFQAMVKPATLNNAWSALNPEVDLLQFRDVYEGLTLKNLSNEDIKCAETTAEAAWNLTKEVFQFKNIHECKSFRELLFKISNFTANKKNFSGQSCIVGSLFQVEVPNYDDIKVKQDKENDEKIK